MASPIQWRPSKVRLAFPPTLLNKLGDLAADLQGSVLTSLTLEQIVSLANFAKAFSVDWTVTAPTCFALYVYVTIRQDGVCRSFPLSCSRIW